MMVSSMLSVVFIHGNMYELYGDMARVDAFHAPHPAQTPMRSKDSPRNGIDEKGGGPGVRLRKRHQRKLNPVIRSWAAAKRARRASFRALVLSYNFPLGGIGGYCLTGVTLCQDIGHAKPAHNPLDRQYFRTRH